MDNAAVYNRYLGSYDFTLPISPKFPSGYDFQKGDAPLPRSPGDYTIRFTPSGKLYYYDSKTGRVSTDPPKQNERVEPVVGPSTLPLTRTDSRQQAEEFPVPPADSESPPAAQGLTPAIDLHQVQGQEPNGLGVAEAHAPPISRSSTIAALDDEGLDYTPVDDFASPFCVEIYQKVGDKPKVTGGVVLHEDIKENLDRFNNEDAQSSDDIAWRLRLFCFQAGYHSDGMHTKKETFEAITRSFDLPQEKHWYSRTPQMATYFFKVPLEKGDMLCHIRGAVQVFNSSLLSYKISQGGRVVNGILIDPREATDVFINRLEMLCTSVPVHCLLAMALAQHSHLKTKAFAIDYEILYYLVKEVPSLPIAPDFKERLFLSKQLALDAQNSFLDLQLSSGHDLLNSIRDQFSDCLDASSTAMLAGMQSEITGLGRLIQRSNRRTKKDDQRYMQRMQTEISHNTMNFAKERNMTLDKTVKLAENSEKTLGVVSKTLEMMKDNGNLLRDLQEYEGKLLQGGRETARWMIGLTLVQVIFQPLGTMAQIFTLPGMPPLMWFVIATVIVLAVIFGGFGAFYVYRRHKDAKDDRKYAGGHNRSQDENVETRSSDNTHRNSNAGQQTADRTEPARVQNAETEGTSLSNIEGTEDIPSLAKTRDARSYIV